MLSHLDEQGRPRMVDVTAKPVSHRTAVAEGAVRMSPTALETLLSGTAAKGSVTTVAELAGTQGAKRTGELIPLCHPLPLDHVQVAVEPDRSLPGVRVRAEVSATARTGVEMEALTAVAVACLTVYDMLKAVDRGMTIEAIGLVRKTGGSRGDWERPA